MGREVAQVDYRHAQLILDLDRLVSIHVCMQQHHTYAMCRPLHIVRQVLGLNSLFLIVFSSLTQRIPTPQLFFRIFIMFGTIAEYTFAHEQYREHVRCASINIMLKCDYCLKPIPRKIFCTPEHRFKYHNRNKKIKPVEIKICKEHGKEGCLVCL